MSEINKKYVIGREHSEIRMNGIGEILELGFFS